jgi:hypothetical protein
VLILGTAKSGSDKMAPMVSLICEECVSVLNLDEVVCGSLQCECDAHLDGGPCEAADAYGARHGCVQ